MSKRLVAYFSASGITAKVAENLADAIGADIFEIQPEVPYSPKNKNSQRSIFLIQHTSKSFPFDPFSLSQMVVYHILRLFEPK